MGLAWQQGPLAPHTVGRFLVRDPLPERLLFAEPLRRRMRVRFADEWIADSENVVLLHEPGRYPVGYFPRAEIAANALEPSGRISEHRDLGPTRWEAAAVKAYRQARRVGYSRRGALRLGLLLALLARHDPPTDTWGRSESIPGPQPHQHESPT